MLEDETGIEIRMRGYDKSFHEIAYLDADKWDGHIPNAAEATYIRHAQKKWVAPQILSCLCLTMYRDEGFGSKRLAEFINKVDNYHFEHNDDANWIMDEMERITGIPRKDII